jgi:hypothetical protein
MVARAMFAGAGAALALGLAGAAHGTPAARPALEVRRVVEPPAALVPGRRVQVSAVVRGAARRSGVDFLLSRDRRRGSDLWLARLRLTGLARGRVSVSTAVPVRAHGAYFLLACSTDRRVARRCRASRRSTAVAPAPPGTGPAPGAGRTPGPAGSAEGEAVGDPPVFAGIDEAVTCASGPGAHAPYELRWTTATDEDTPPESIVYEIHQGGTPGQVDGPEPTYVTAPGATGFTTPPLPVDELVLFVVHARDAHGNRDDNTVELPGENRCGQETASSSTAAPSAAAATSTPGSSLASPSSPKNTPPA